GGRPENQRREQVSAELGRAERLRDRRERLPAERRLQPDRNRRRAHLPRAGSDQEQIPETTRAAGLSIFFEITDTGESHERNFGPSPFLEICRRSRRG